MEQKKYKYQKQLDELIALGCQLPELYAPNNLKACRFAYCDLNSSFEITKHLINDENDKRI